MRCDGCSNQAAHYHNLGPQLGASLLTRHIGWKQKKEKEEEEGENQEDVGCFSLHFNRICTLFSPLVNNINGGVGCVTVLPSWRHNPEYCLEK
jgi:hypothetical protein